MDRIKVYHFLNNTCGGAFTVAINLLKFRNALHIENHLIFTIEYENRRHFKLPIVSEASSSTIFYYSKNWNFNYTCRKLSELLPCDNSIIIANDWLELGMVSHLGLKNPLIYILHGDYEYYYDLARKHALNIDYFLCVAKSISEKLKFQIPELSKKINYLKFPVNYVSNKNTNDSITKILFLGRFENSKGYNILPKIDEELRKFNIFLNWTLIGAKKSCEIIDWGIGRVNVINEITNDQVIDQLHCYDVLVLPSLAEGMPLVIIEAMKAGIIPIVNDIEGGIQELVTNGITGYKIVDNSSLEYAKTIHSLVGNKEQILQIRKNCIAYADCNFDPYKNTKLFESVFIEVQQCKRKKYKLNIYGSRLDKIWLPNIFVNLYRVFLNRFKNER